jgi:Ycf66 protein N-terminus
MINFSFSPNIFLGIMVLIGVLILYFLRNVKAEASRDEDIFFATITLLYSSILIIHGWRLDPILLFSQVLIIITALLTGWENIRLRGLITKIRKSSKIKKDKKKY